MALSIIGAGSWGEALFRAIKKGGKEVVITSRTKRDIEGFVKLEEALQNEYLIIAISSQSLKQFLKKVDLKGKKVLVASKGIDKEEFKFINEIYEEFLDRDNLAYIGGPSFAKEVREYKPTALVIASYNLQLAKQFANFFSRFYKDIS